MASLVHVDAIRLVTAERETLEALKYLSDNWVDDEMLWKSWSNHGRHVAAKILGCTFEFVTAGKTTVVLFDLMSSSISSSSRSCHLARVVQLWSDQRLRIWSPTNVAIPMHRPFQCYSAAALSVDTEPVTCTIIIELTGAARCDCEDFRRRGGACKHRQLHRSLKPLTKRVYLRRAYSPTLWHHLETWLVLQAPSSARSRALTTS